MPTTTNAPVVRPISTPGRSRVQRAIALEAAGWRSTGRWLARRPVVPDGAEGHRYDGPIRVLLWAFLIVSAVELVAVDVLTRPWPWIRIPMLVLGVWGVLFMLGMILSYTTRPHAVGPAGIRVRSGGEADLDLPWAVVAGVSRRHRHVGKAPEWGLSGEGEAQVLHHVVQESTDVEVALEGPTTLLLPNGEVTVARVHLSVDDPVAFLESVRRHMP